MKPLDDPQLRSKLIKASSDMPHVDVWAKIQAEAGDISQAAQARSPRTRFSIFSGLQLLAPAFIVLLVFGATLLSLAEEPTHQTQRTTRVPSVESVTASSPTIYSSAVAYDIANLTYDRLMARYADRLEGTPPNGHTADSDVLAVTYAPEYPTSPSGRVETRDDMRAEWREYVEQKQPRARSDTLHLIRPFLSPLTPQ
ncbi:MAG: hypothetical protein KIT87_27805 [Anaerolineae bacterium]|nr:hypothetical protein [Anaerolineae bacterium]